MNKRDPGKHTGYSGQRNAKSELRFRRQALFPLHLEDEQGSGGRRGNKKGKQSGMPFLISTLTSLKNVSVVLGMPHLGLQNPWGPDGPAG